jgi:hypothetical protein
VRHRWLRIAILVFEAFWLNVLVPGHQRGCVALPGAQAVAACPLCDSATPAAHSKSHTPVDRSGTCAICFFAAHLSVPPTIDLSLPPLQLRGWVQGQRAHNLVARLVQIPFDGRGPPACA